MPDNMDKAHAMNSLPFQVVACIHMFCGHCLTFLRLFTHHAFFYPSEGGRGVAQLWTTTLEAWLLT